MNLLLWNVLLAILWTAVMGGFSFSGLLVGFAVGYLVLMFSRPLIPTSDPVVNPARYFTSLFQFLSLLLFFLKELVLSSVTVARDILHPKMEERITPCVIALPLDATRDLHITLLANMISLTPGTLSLDVSDDRKVLYIHSLYTTDDLEKYKRSMKDGFEKRIMEVFS